LRIFIALMLVILCSLSAAEDDPYLNLPATFSLVLGSKTSYFRFEHQLCNMRGVYNGDFVSQIDLDFAVLSPGIDCLTDNWWAGITALYTEEAQSGAQLIGQKPKPPQMFFQFYHKSRFAEGRIYLPLVHSLEGIRYHPWAELERLRLFRPFPNTEIFLRGIYEIGKSPEFELGVYQNLKGLTLEATTGGAYSIGAKYTTAF